MNKIKLILPPLFILIGFFASFINIVDGIEPINLSVINNSLVIKGLLGFLLFMFGIISFLRNKLIKSANIARPHLEKLFYLLQQVSIEKLKFDYKSKSRFTTSVDILLASKKIAYILIFEEKRITIICIKRKWDNEILLLRNFLNENNYEVVIKQEERDISCPH